MQKVYLGFGAATAFPSVCMYAMAPGGTVQHFGGAITNSSKFWCSTAASGDILVIFWNLVALHYNNKIPEITKNVVRGNFIFSIFHFGAFWYWHVKGDPHPQGVAMYPFALAVAFASLLAWGR